MSKRKPNNLPWILLGALCGLGFLGLFGLGFYTGANPIWDEMTITIPEAPDSNADARAKNKLTIYVNENNEITLEGIAFENVSALKEGILASDTVDLGSTIFILRLSEDASHNSSISVKDMLNEIEVRSVLEIVRSAEQ